jgi:hypothetical protein
MAENNGKVDKFYRAAISAGARDNISLRARLEYYPGYYAADRDCGNKGGRLSRELRVVLWSSSSHSGASYAPSPPQAVTSVVPVG